MRLPAQEPCVISTQEEALLFIQGLQSRGNDILAIFSGRDESVHFRLFASRVRVTEQLRLVVETVGVGQIVVNLKGARFDYKDVRQAPEELLDAVERIEGILDITLPSGDALCLAEVRPLDA